MSRARPPLPYPIEQALSRLGSNTALARKRRRLRQADVAARTGLTVATVARIERGHPGTSMSAYLAALWVLGLEREFADLASPDRDEEGKTLEASRQPRRVGSTRALDDDF